MGKPQAPAPPSPKEMAAGQTGTNVTTAMANNAMGMVDQNTPYGNMSYSQTGSQSFTDPYTGQTYDVPKYASNLTLNPQQQATLDASQGAQTNMANLAQQQSGFLQDYMGQPMDVNQDTENRLYDLATKRIDPRFEQQEAATRDRLAQQGVMPGSEAYNREMTNQAQFKNDAYNQLALTGRGQAVNESYAARNQPINEITALLSGSQVTNPQVSSYSPSRMPTVDVAGLQQQNYGQQMNAYNQKMQQQQGLLGGLFGAAGTVLGGPMAWLN